jgi:tetratricopeptide (TPR) repeat protein
MATRSKTVTKPIRWLVGAAIAIVGLLAVGYKFWQAGARRSVAESSIPTLPPLSDKPAELSQRINFCEQRIRTGSDVVAALIELSQLYHANGLYAEASQCYRGLLRIDPSNPRWSYRFAIIASSYGQLDDAVGLWRHTLALTKNYTPAYIHLADALFKLNRPAEAAALYKTVLLREPNNPYALLGLARIDIGAGHWTDARAHLESAFVHSDNSVGYDLLVNVCEQQGDSARAREIRSQHKVSGAFFDIPDPWLREIYVDCYDSYQLSVVGGTAEREGDRATGLSLVERAVRLEPKNAYYHFQAANLNRELGNLDEARRQLETAVSLEPDLADAWENLFKLLTALGQSEDAWRTLARGLANCPNSPSLHFLRGRLLLSANRREEAIPDFKQAAEARPDDASATFALALIYSSLGRNSESVTALQEALIAEPGYPPALCTLARDYIVSGDEPKAFGVMQKVRDQPRVPPQERLKLEQAFEQKFGRKPFTF